MYKRQAIDGHVLKHTELQKRERLLRSIDGVGRMIAATILAEVPQICILYTSRCV